MTQGMDNQKTRTADQKSCQRAVNTDKQTAHMETGDTWQTDRIAILNIVQLRIPERIGNEPLDVTM